MEHRTVEQLRTVAAIRSEEIPQMSRGDRLQRWARLLELDPERRLNTLRRTEYVNPSRRGPIRADASPISIALADPVLRAEGLRDDTYGEAKRFFDLSDRQMHEILCLLPLWRNHIWAHRGPGRSSHKCGQPSWVVYQTSAVAGLPEKRDEACAFAKNAAAQINGAP